MTVLFILVKSPSGRPSALSTNGGPLGLSPELKPTAAAQVRFTPRPMSRVPFMPYPTHPVCAGPPPIAPRCARRLPGAPLNWDGGEHDRDGHARCAAGLS